MIGICIYCGEYLKDCSHANFSEIKSKDALLVAYKEVLEFYANPDNWAIHKDSEGKDYCPMTFKTYIPAQKVLRDHAQV